MTEIHCNQEAEQLFVGSLFNCNGSLVEHINEVDPNDFYVTSVGCVYGAMQQLFDKDEPIDIVNVKRQLELTGDISRLDTPFAYLQDLSLQYTDTDSLSHYADIIKLEAKKRLLQDKMNIISNRLLEVGDITDLNTLIESNVQEVVGDSDDGNMSGIAEATEHCMNRMVQLNKLGDYGIKTGFTGVDQHVVGLLPGQLTIIGARTSVGKSLAVVNMVKDIVLNQDRKAVIFSMEMGCDSILYRLLSLGSGVNHTSLTDGTVLDNPLDRQKIDQFGEVMKEKGNLTIDDTSTLTLTDVKAKIMKVKKRTGCDIVFIDYLQLMNPPKADNRNLEIGALSRGLKIMSKDLNVHICALSQLSRGVEGSVPTLASLRDSGSLEQDANKVFLLHRTGEEASKENNFTTQIDWHIAKNREGSCGHIPLRLEGTIQKFTEV